MNNSFAQTCGAALCRVMTEHRIEARPAGKVINGARTLAFPVALSTSADLGRMINLDEAMAFRAGVEGCRIARARSAVLVEFEKPRGRWDTVAIRHPGAGLALKLGLDVLNRPARLDLAQPETAHVLAAGATGSGKSTLIRALVWQAVQATPDRLRLVLIDTKRELGAFYGLPHLAQQPATDPGAAVALLEWVAGSLDNRTPQSTPMLIVIDELADLVATSRNAVPAVTRIARLGRGLHVHLIAGTQYVSRETLGDPQLKANLTCRLAGRVENAQASALATGFADLGAHRLTGSGDFLLADAGRAVRFTAPVLTEQQLAGLPMVSVQPAAVSIEPPLWQAEHVGWVLHYADSQGKLPGRERIRTTLNLGGSAKATALRDYCAAVIERITELAGSNPIGGDDDEG